MTDLLLQSTTGNPSQYEVIADEQIVGRIALYSALRDQSKGLGYGRLISSSRKGGIQRTASRRRARPRCRRSLDPGSETGEANGASGCAGCGRRGEAPTEERPSNSAGAQPPLGGG